MFYLATPEGEEAEYLYEPLLPESYRYYEFGEDCNDAEATIKPGAVELCDEIDQNCNGQSYDVADGDLYYLDLAPDDAGVYTWASLSAPRRIGLNARTPPPTLEARTDS